MEENNTNNSYRGPSSNIWIGLAFIGGGAIVLLNQTGLLNFELNWWALFILFPAFGALSGAYNRYRATNDLFSMGVMMPALIGLFMVALAFSFLFGGLWSINWNLYWPLILIIIGLSMIFGRSRKE
jgi:hypothetical protein